MELRARDPVGFAEAMLEAHIREYMHFADCAEPVVFDRGFPDVAGFYDLTGRAVPHVVEYACRTMRYNGPILRAPAWAEIYVQDTQQIQTLEEAIASDIAITAAWKRYDYEVTDLPLVDVETRLAFLCASLQLAA